ncbi:hypothetical protein DFP73DRAFT_529818 [Morchella snyderi]|nr:hypothetical protein DFP73DRAFT_529818 [Morchella snyderi]
MDRRRSGPPAVLNHHLQPTIPTTSHTVAAAHITPVDTVPTLTVAHPVTQAHLYQVFNYEIYPSWTTLHRNVSADLLPAQGQQMDGFAAATAWMHDDALPEYYAMVQVASSSGEGTGNVHAADISPVRSGATQSSAAAATTKPGRKKCIRGPRGPYKKRQRANSDTSTATDYTAATATDNRGKKGSGELRVKKKRHGGGRKKGEVVCNLCGVEFTRPFTLKRHLANMHAESAVCVCGIRFKVQFGGLQFVGVDLGWKGEIWKRSGVHGSFWVIWMGLKSIGSGKCGL